MLLPFVARKKNDVLQGSLCTFCNGVVADGHQRRALLSSPFPICGQDVEFVQQVNRYVNIA